MTHEAAAREAWLAERRLGIGGSDWENALALGPYGCQRRLVYEKRNIEPDFDEGDPEGYLIRGQKMEALVVEEAEERIGITCRRQTRLARPDWLPDWWIGNIDRMVVGGGIFEAKTKNPWLFKALVRDGIPVREVAQVQHYMALADRSSAIYACLEPVSWDFYWTEVNRDDDLIGKMLLAGDWLWSAVENGPFPGRLMPDSKACKRCPWRWTCHGEALFATSGAAKDEPVEREVISDESMVELVREAYEIKDLVAEANERLDEIKDQVKARLGGPKKVAIDGHAINWITYSKKQFQTAAFRKAHPDLAEEFTKMTSGEAFRWD